MLRRRLRIAAALAALGTLALGACAPRVPVVVAPAYPDFLYPEVPAEYADTALASQQRDAWAFLQAGEVNDAADRFAILTAREPTFYPAQTGLGWANLARGAYGEAAAHFAAAARRRPAYLPALVGLGEAFLADDNPAAALRGFEAALAVAPGMTRVDRIVRELRLTVSTERLARAEAAAARGDWAEAEAAYGALVEASPDSAFLHVALARVRLGQGDLDGAFAWARRATTLDPENGPALLVEGDILEARGDLTAAEAAFLRADTVDPSDESAARLARVRGLRRIAAMPAEYRAIPARGEVTRADLAALVGVRFESLLAEAGVGEATPIITDAREHWGLRWILAVTQARVMAVDAAYRFEPHRILRRGDLAEAAANVLHLIAEVDPTVAAGGGVGGPPRIADMRETHLNYASVVDAVAAGVLTTFADGSFRPTRPVSGAEAVEALERLGALLGDAG